MKVIANTIDGHLARVQLLARLLGDESSTSGRIETALADAVVAFGLHEVGIRWPVTGQPQFLAASGQANGEVITKWRADVANRLCGAMTSADVIFDPEDGNRLLIPMLVNGHRNGVFWAIAPSGFDEEERQGLVVLAQCLSRHPSFVDRIGAWHDRGRIAQRLGDAALVAGKIAHDFDNIFTGVVGFAEIALSLLEPGSLPHQYVQEINSAGTRGIQFTQQLHGLSRSGMSRPMPATVSTVLSREETRLRKSTTSCRFQFIIPNDLPAVAIDGGALQIIVGNLLDNAVEASRPGSLVRVTASLVELSDAESREFLGAASSGPFVEICVGDEGPGITDEHRKKMFVEPFFTTKVRHRGLGLPVVYRVLHAHRGGIRFETAPGRGSVFQMVLPLAAARSSEQSSVPHDVKRIPGGNAT